MKVALAKIEKYVRKGWKVLSSVDDKFLDGKRLVWSKTVWAYLLRATRKNDTAILQAKNLPHYPRAERPSSDDKRIDFLAKVFAGFAFGLAPLTATKRLSRWKPLGVRQKPISQLQEAAAKRKEHARQRLKPLGRLQC